MMEAYTVKPACVVEVIANDVKDSRSCSGVIISPRLILTHATLLSGHVQKHKQLLTKFKKNNADISNEFNNINVKVTLENDRVSKKYDTPQKYATALLNVKTSAIDSTVCYCTGKVCKVFQVKSFAKSIGTLFSKDDNWKFTDENKNDSHENNDELTTEDIAAILPYFVLVQLPRTFSLSSKYDIVSLKSIKPGARLSTMSTPFGALSTSVFLNSVSEGVLSNKRESLFLTDARCIPGSEGGAVMTTNKSGLLGVIVSPLYWKSNEWMGMTIGCSIESILRSMNRVEFSRKLSSPPNDSTYVSKNISEKSDTSEIMNNLCFIQNGGQWGTGFILDPEHRLIVTCSHVVKHNNTVDVRIGPSTVDWYTAKVLYSTTDAAAFDIALLQLDVQCTLECSTLTICEDFREGQSSYVIGHALFGREHTQSPSVSRGVLSRVITVDRIPVLVQSTCCVQSGASGGPVVTADGQLIAMVTCNARDTDSGATYPHVNMCIPMCTVKPVIDEYIKSKDTTVLDKLHVSSPMVQRLWALKKTDMTESMSWLSKL